MQLRSGRRDQDPDKDRPPTPRRQFHRNYGAGPEVPRLRSLTELCGLWVTMESNVVPKDLSQCKRC
jgi:hypothetical protein